MYTKQSTFHLMHSKIFIILGLREVNTKLKFGSVTSYCIHKYCLVYI